MLRDKEVRGRVGGGGGGVLLSADTKREGGGVSCVRLSVGMPAPFVVILPAVVNPL